ncbi:hypothetical protein JCM17961_42800 [Endothiovibrio diazotrophicus]
MLYIDDDAALRTLVARRLGDPLFRVTTALDGDQGLALLERGGFDVVLLDYDLPRRNGLEILGAAAAHPEPPPVIMLTANHDVSVAVQAIRLGAYDYLVKDRHGEYLNRLPATIHGAIRNHGERLRYEKYLALFEQIFRHTTEAVVVTDLDARIVDVNPAFCEITGYPRDEVIGRNPKLMKSDRHPPEFYQAMWAELRANGHWQGEVWDRRKCGDLYPKWLSISAVTDPRGRTTHYVGIFSDISSIKRTEERLTRLAHYDPLTGLPNRSLFHDRLEQALLHSQRHHTMMAVMFLDIDHFKQINDTLGHAVGDELLVAVADRLRACIRKSDTIARLGGDEFTVIVTDIGGSRHAARIARKLLESMAPPVLLAGRRIHVTPSIGISLYPGAGDDTEELIKAADIAMYRAKEEGRNNYQFFHHDLHPRGGDTLGLASDLHLALERGELELHYQPQVEPRGRRIVAVEALLRWNHPSRGAVPPEEFITLAEENGLIVRIGEWVLRQACRQLRQWQEQRLAPVRMAVNLSAIQLRRPGFADTVCRILDEENLAPEWLELEIVENIAMHQTDGIAQTLHRLREMGVRIAIDDFGTGYSSLSHLKHLPVDSLKIDRSFIEQIGGGGDDHDAAAISSAILAMARSLGLSVVAEGVETDAQLAFLGDAGDCLAQGFYFSQPVPAAQCAGLLGAATVAPPTLTS